MSISNFVCNYSVGIEHSLSILSRPNNVTIQSSQGVGMQSQTDDAAISKNIYLLYFSDKSFSMKSISISFSVTLFSPPADAGPKRRSIPILCSMQ